MTMQNKADTSHQESTQSAHDYRSSNFASRITAVIRFNRKQYLLYTLLVIISVAIFSGLMLIYPNYKAILLTLLIGYNITLALVFYILIRAKIKSQANNYKLNDSDANIVPMNRTINR